MHYSVLGFLICVVLIDAGTNTAYGKVRIYGGPVQSAGSGRYYPPGGMQHTIQQSTVQHHSVMKPVRPLHSLQTGSLDSGLFSGEGYSASSYIPSHFPRPVYQPVDFVGYYSRPGKSQ